MKYLLPLLAVLLITAAVGTNFGSTRKSIDREPVACSGILAASRVRDERDREIGRLQDTVREGAHAAQALEQLGYRYAARARERGDEGDYVLAERTAACLLATQPNHLSALLLQGHVLHQMHRFDQAEAIARRLVASRQFVLDYGLLGDVLMERGRLAEAADAYQKMVDLKPFYQSYTRAAHLRWLRGDLDGAIELLRIAIAAASPRDPESIAWGYSRLAAYETQAARLRDAERSAEAALSHKPDYAAALLAKGRVQLAMDRRDEAVETLRRAAQLKAEPEFQWTLADALRLVGRHADAHAVERELMEYGARRDPRTLALFLATRRASASYAVWLAEHERGERADVFTLDALAWALAAAGRVEEAEPLMVRALSEGTQDGRLFLHAAAISAAAGRRTDARRWVAKADRVRPMLLPSELDELGRIRTGLSAAQEK